MAPVRFSVLAAATIAAGFAAMAITPANAEFFGCNTPKVRYYSGTPWSYHAPYHVPAVRRSYAAATYRVTRPVYHDTRHSYRTQW